MTPSRFPRIGRPTGWPGRPVLTCSSTPTTRSTGIPGARRRSRRAEGRGQADLPVDRLLGLPLVPRHGARELRESRRSPALMNEHFVSIKVDREERPDLDQIYMTAVQVMTGHGGWPMSVFLTPDLEPFYGGTYFPPDRLAGHAGLSRGPARACTGPGRSGATRSSSSAGEMTERLQPMGDVAAPRRGCARASSILDQAARGLARSASTRVHGGFGQAPKFPHPMDLRVLLRQHARTGDDHALHVVRHTLDKMARGGIYDHLGGGFARYSTDERWLVPHFEKMLYDNALLASVYLEAYQAHRRPRASPGSPARRSTTSSAG